jgi:hypothetical protein
MNDRVVNVELASATSIQDGWPGCVWWLASANGSEMDDWVVIVD